MRFNRPSVTQVENQTGRDSKHCVAGREQQHYKAVVAQNCILGNESSSILPGAQNYLYGYVFDIDRRVGFIAVRSSERAVTKSQIFCMWMLSQSNSTR